MNINRRSLLTGLVSLVAAPAIVRVQSIMPVSARLALPPFPSLDGFDGWIGELRITRDSSPYVLTVVSDWGFAPPIQTFTMEGTFRRFGDVWQTCRSGSVNQDEARRLLGIKFLSTGPRDGR